MFGLAQKLVEIQMTGIEDARDKKGSIHVYGVRRSDTAGRVVGVAVDTRVAAELMAEAEREGSFPILEVLDKHWFYVAVLGPSHFNKESLPS